MENEKINALIKAEIQKGCSACNSLGVWHCTHPSECGNWDELIRLENEKKRLK